MTTSPTYTARECIDGPWGALTCLIEEDGRKIAYCHRDDLEGIVSALVAATAPVSEVGIVVNRIKAMEAANDAADAERVR